MNPGTRPCAPTGSGSCSEQRGRHPSQRGRESEAISTSRRVLSPRRGRDITAQGEALGNARILVSALKGRDIRSEYTLDTHSNEHPPIRPCRFAVVDAWDMFRPFRAFGMCPVSPRALPWAVMLRPFGAL